jgi:HK97 family phage major capsid protein
MFETLKELIEKRDKQLSQAESLISTAEEESRDLNETEQESYDGLIEGIGLLDKRIERMGQLNTLKQAGVVIPEQPIMTREQPQAPAFNRIGRGDTEARAMAHYIRTGDGGGLREVRASNNTDMNIGTDADGGYAVPVGHFNGIVARRDESMIAARLGVRNIPGMGTTVNVPLDSEDDGEFVSTSEAASTDRDAPALGQKAMTLVKYTKRVEMSWELLDDEDSQLMAFLDDFVGRGMAKTHNNLLLTEVAANGTNLTTYASATAIAAGEPENVVENDNLSNYLDDAGSVGWVMRSTTHWAIKSITGNDRLYAEQTAGSRGMTLLGYPVVYSNKAAAIASTAVTTYFGNWNLVGLREGPSFEIIRDPYSNAATGQLTLHYYFRAVYGVLQAEAIGYADQAA